MITLEKNRGNTHHSTTPGTATHINKTISHQNVLHPHNQVLAVGQIEDTLPSVHKNRSMHIPTQHGKSKRANDKST
jgi:hypothetical protein